MVHPPSRTSSVALPMNVSDARALFSTVPVTVIVSTFGSYPSRRLRMASRRFCAFGYLRCVMISRQLTRGIAGLLFAFGMGAIVAPRRSAALGFGVPLDDADRGGAAFVRATGSRDILLGALILAALPDAHALARTLRAIAFVGIADAAVVVLSSGLRPQLAFHLGGVAALVVTAAAVDHDL